MELYKKESWIGFNTKSISIYKKERVIMQKVNLRESYNNTNV